MTETELRSLIYEIGKKFDFEAEEIEQEAGEIKNHEYLMSCICQMANICISDSHYNIPDFIESLLFYHYKKIPIETGKYRIIWREFVKSRAEWRHKEIKDFTLFCFTITQLLCRIPEHHFKSQIVGDILGMVYGWCDQNGIEIEGMMEQTAKTVGR